jgi:RNA polymerase-binding transcription factor DksA
MSELQSGVKSLGRITGNRRFIRARRDNDSIFTIEDARECIRVKKESVEHEVDAQIIEQKRDILAQQSSSANQHKIGTASIADIFGFNPIQAKQTNIRDRDPEEIPQKFRKYYKLLLRLRDDVKKGLSKLANDNLAMSVGKTKQDAIDQEIESFDSEFAISLMSNEQEALTEIEEAIQRIHEGTYGICELTGKPIEAKRLLAIPFARYSVEGQMEKEKIRQSEINRGSIFQTDQTSDDLAEFESQDEE